MVIGACGFGSTGSSVVTDYLKEYDHIKVEDDFEFTWVTRTDGLIDLERSLMNPHGRTSDSITAIRRFRALEKRLERTYEMNGLSKETFRKLVDDFIRQITMVEWNWYDSSVSTKFTPKSIAKYIMKKKVIPKFEVRAGHQINCWPMEPVCFSVNPTNFYSEASKLVQKMLEEMGFNQNNVIALDQPFSGNNPQVCFPFFHDPYAIVVDRDPRDNYVFARTKLLGKNHFMAVEPVEDFIKYYRALRDGQPYLQQNERVLCIKFEDMVYEYEDTTKKLREFLNLSENPRPKSIFNPELSKANTQVFRRFPQFLEDIKKIEAALPEYLFDFSKYPEPEPNAQMFYGKSPLNPGKQRKQ